MAKLLEDPEDQTSATAPRSLGSWLILWILLVLILQTTLWVTGFRPFELNQAVDQGAARVERRSLGEVGDDLIREGIANQRDTIRFWTALALLGDFVMEPLSLALRATAVAVVFSALAALTGRPIEFGRALAASVVLQGIWVLGLATRTALMIVLQRPEVETSAVLALPPGPYPAPFWEALRQLDAFALFGWSALALTGWRRGQVSLLTAIIVCLLLWTVEAGLRISGTLMMGAGMRLTIVPGG